MSWMLEAEPRPRSRPLRVQCFSWPQGRSSTLSHPRQPRQLFCDVVNARRSRRTFGCLDESDLSTLLWFSARAVYSTAQDPGLALEPNSERDRELDPELGPELSWRPVPSAGAIHPIHILICSARSGQWQRYDPNGHALVTVPEGLLPVHAALALASGVVPPGEGTLIWLAADTAKTSAKYAHAESLVWRDAGVLLGQLGLVSSLLGLHFCPLGMTGSLWGEALAKNSDERHLLRGVGLAVIGAPPSF